MYRVEHDYEGEWLTGTREDLYDGENDQVLEVPAEFNDRREAEQYITDLCGLIHCGGDPSHFRIVEAEASADTDPIALPLGPEAHRASDPHCTCNDCVTFHFRSGPHRFTPASDVDGCVECGYGPDEHPTEK